NCLHDRDDHDEHLGTEGLSQEAAVRPRLRLPARPAAKPSDQVDGPGIREPRLQRLSRAALGPFSRGPASYRRRSRGDPPDHQNLAEAAMNLDPNVLLSNLLAWSAQIAILTAVGALAALTLGHPRARLLFWQGLLAIALLLPAIQPWTQPSAVLDHAVTI